MLQMILNWLSTGYYNGALTVMLAIVSYHGIIGIIKAIKAPPQCDCVKCDCQDKDEEYDED